MGFYYYCSIYSCSVSSSAKYDGYCYDNAAHAYLATPCTLSQIQSDTYQTGACSGAGYGAYFCPLSSGSSSSSFSSSSLTDGLSDGELTCAQAVVSQVLASGTAPLNSFQLSDSTCDTCGRACERKKESAARLSRGR